MSRYRWLIVIAVMMAGLAGGAFSRASPDPSVERFLNAMYAERAQGLVTGAALRDLERLYDSSVQSGRFALAHEQGRIAYVQAWATARKLRITDAETLVTNLRVRRSGGTATVSLIARTRLAYQYEGSEQRNEMGIGSWHWLQLVQDGDGWRVQREYYLDALGSEWSQPSPGAVSPAAPGSASPAGAGRIDRAGAARYAEKYCGAAWGCGNSSDYNQRYQSYRTLGGDCANFASQTLVEGGKAKPDGAWRYAKAGSACWVNAEAFSRHLIGSGRATLLARGTYPKVAAASAKMKPGDIVAYQVKGTVTHVSIVTAIDSAGVPLVTAHTADRFRNPWDLGWDKDTVYWLIHLRD